MNPVIISIDAETNGLWGQAIQIAAVCSFGNEIFTFNGQCPPKGEVDPWVKENVIPHIDGEMYKDYESLLKAFCDWYLDIKRSGFDVDVIVHVGVPVEAKLFIDSHERGFIGDWDAPFPLIDISAFPEVGTSVDKYNKEHEVEVPYKGSVHNALYDSWAALKCYERLQVKFLKAQGL